MEFYSGQICSIVTLVIAVVSIQFKDVKVVLAGQIAANLTTAFSYVFLGGISGAWICIVAAVQACIIYWGDVKEFSDRARTIWTILFAVMYVVGTAVVYKHWGDLVSCACAMLYIGAIIQKDTSKFRWFAIANAALWLLYDMKTGAYVNIITHSIMLISYIAAKIRLDRKTV